MGEVSWIFFFFAREDMKWLNKIWNRSLIGITDITVDKQEVYIGTERRVSGAVAEVSSPSCGTWGPMYCVAGGGGAKPVWDTPQEAAWAASMVGGHAWSMLR